MKQPQHDIMARPLWLRRVIWSAPDDLKDEPPEGCMACDWGHRTCPCPNACLIAQLEVDYARVRLLWWRLLAAVAMVAAAGAWVWRDDVLHAIAVLTGAR